MQNVLKSYLTMFKRKAKYDYQGLFNPSKLDKFNIDRLSTRLVPHNSKILELGCATGFMSRYFTKEKQCQVYGVDIDKKALAIAKKYCHKTILGNLDNPTTWNKIKQFKPFDVVFASSVIEHLINPKNQLQLIKQVLKPKGILIITVPNVAHWRMRLQLMLGKWDYQAFGLLDKNHLRFFTYFTFQQLLKNAGFKINTIAIDPAGGIKYFNWLVKNFPNLYAHQLVIQANL